MSWTAINSGDALPAAYNTAITEMFTAINQRRGAIGLSNASASGQGPRGDYLGTTGNWRENVNTLRAQCGTLITPIVGGTYAGNCYVKSDYTTWADTAALLTTAGHSGVWIDLTAESNIRVESFDLVLEQIQDVLAELIYYRFNVTTVFSSAFPSGSGERLGQDNTGVYPATGAQITAANESAWDSAKADTVASPPNFDMENPDWTFPYAIWDNYTPTAMLCWVTTGALINPAGPDPLAEYQWWILFGPEVRVTINLTGTRGACIKAKMQFLHEYNADVGIDTFNSCGGAAVADDFGNSWSVAGSDSSAYDIYSNVTVNSSNVFDYSITTSEAASAPITVTTRNEETVVGFMAFYYPYETYFYFNISSYLTYG